MLSIEPLAPSQQAERAEIHLVRFHAFDGGTRIVVEVTSEDEARYLCNEMGWELICCCEG